jgi:hypothetical protein
MPAAACASTPTGCSCWNRNCRARCPQLAPDGVARVALPVAVNADSLATWFAPAVAAFAADAPVLLELAVDDQDHTDNGCAAARCWPP